MTRGDSMAHKWLVTDGVIIPAVCGKFGILPLRLRARVACAAHNGQASLASINNALGTGHATIGEAVASMTPWDAWRVSPSIHECRC